MMNFLLTLFLTFLFVLFAIIFFIKIAPPVYRLEKTNIVALLNLVIEGKATDNDWEVFLGMPIRHNDELEAIRMRCSEISEREYIGGSSSIKSKHLLTEKGIEEVKNLLAELTGEAK
jgi:hypothetical protein